MPAHSNEASKFLMPGAILISALLIAVTIVVSNNDTRAEGASAERAADGRVQTNLDIRPVTDADHVRGAAEPAVTFIEYSDYQCPFCGRLHPHLKRLTEENTDVQWVYRHYPLSSIHSDAKEAAIASECMARLGGTDAFWSFTDAVFEDSLALQQDSYSRYATRAGIDASSFAACIESSDAEMAVNDDLQEVTSAGGRGTPYTVVVTKSGNYIPFSGALPYAQLESILELARNN